MIEKEKIKEAIENLSSNIKNKDDKMKIAITTGAVIVGMAGSFLLGKRRGLEAGFEIGFKAALSLRQKNAPIFILAQSKPKE